MQRRKEWAHHAAYLKRLLRHKQLVLEEGKKLGVPLIRLLLHDLSKFMPDEWRAGVAFYHKGAGNDEALRRHYTRNRHHPQWWVRGSETLPMPDVFRLEMLADWRAMARERGNNPADWYAKRGRDFPFHPDTREWIEDMLFGRISRKNDGDIYRPLEVSNER